MALRLLFFGTPAFAVPTLEALLGSAHQVVAVVTQPDRPRGRGHKPQPEAVKRAADAAGVPVLQPERLKSAELLDQLRAFVPDLAIVAAYGRLLPQPLLDLPRLGFINVHASLLPRWRGAAPVHRAIIAGDADSGITIMRVVLALDAGPMLAREVTPIDPNETSVDLEARLAAMGGRLAVDVVNRLASGPVQDIAQDDRLATYAAKLDRSDSPIDWEQPAIAIHNRIRGLHPWPLATSRLLARRLLLLRSAVQSHEPATAAPGTIVEVQRDALLVAAHPGIVRLVELQPEGRRPMSVRDFLNGVSVRVGNRFDVPG